jgi:3-phosphoshikimate 1-carboxyvinyltransferase
MTLRFSAPRGIGGEITPPPDKSITHRALLLAGLADGPSRVVNPLATGDCLATRACLEALGVAIEERGGAWEVTGGGLDGWAEPAGILDARNSGTSIRLLVGALAGRPLYAVLSGDASLCSRPMLRVVEPLRAMGARIEGRAGGRLAPLTLLPGSGRLQALRYDLPVPSAQVKSALLLAALRADGESSFGGQLASRDHTERLLSFLGVPPRAEGGRLLVAPARSLPAFELEVPGDPSSAAFFLTAALLSGRQLEVKGCALNPTRLGFVQVLRRMGARIEAVPEASQGGEPVGRLLLQAGELEGELAAAAVEAAEVAALIDEIPLIAVLGAFARGSTRVRGAEELRHKESDRLQAVSRLLEAVGGRVELVGDGFEVEGPQRLHAGTVDPRGDHRIAMAAAVLGAGIPDGVSVSGFEAAAVSFPDFVAAWRGLGGEAE